MLRCPKLEIYIPYTLRSWDPSPMQQNYFLTFQFKNWQLAMQTQLISHPQLHWWSFTYLVCIGWQHIHTSRVTNVCTSWPVLTSCKAPLHAFTYALYIWEYPALTEAAGSQGEYTQKYNLYQVQVQPEPSITYNRQTSINSKVVTAMCTSWIIQASTL